MIDHHHAGEFGGDAIKIREIFDVHQELRMPTQPRHACGEFSRRIELHAHFRHQIRTKAAHAGLVQRIEFGISHVFAQQRNGAQPATGLRHGIHDHLIVGAVHARLHHHATRNADGVVHGEIVFQKHRRLRVQTVIGIAVFFALAEDVRVAVAGIGRQGE